MTPPLSLDDLPRPLASYVDHTMLKPDAGEEDIRRLVGEAKQAGFAAAMVPPCWVGLAAGELEGSGVAATTVISFPLGYVDPRVRLAEALMAVSEGAAELDTVMNLTWLKSGDDARVADDLDGWVEALRQVRADLVLKVIIETALLTEDEKRRAAELTAASGADFVKTSTGFGPGGATVEDVALLSEVVDGRCRVKASGGIRDLDTALAMIAAGADRLGASSGRQLLAEAEERRRPAS